MQAPAPMRAMARRLASADRVVGSVGSLSGAFIATPFAAEDGGRLLTGLVDLGLGRVPAPPDGRLMGPGWRARPGLGSAGRGDLDHQAVDTPVTGRWMPA